MHRRICGSLGLVLLAGVTGSAAAADQLLLHQSLPVDEAGRSFVLVDRSRISHATAAKEGSQAHRITIRLATEPPVELVLTCNDAAITRQVLEALRQGATATLDLTGRCRL